MNRRKRILGHYEPRIHPSRDSFDILDWASASSQRARFEILADNVPLAGKSLLDVGCGLGDLWGFLKERGTRAHYTGVDLSEKMLAEARRRHGDAEFVCADLFDEEHQAPLPRQSYDVVYCSGIFNLSLGNNEAFLLRAVEVLRPLAGETLAFNLLHARARGSDGNYAYYDPDRVIQAVASPGWKVDVLDRYLHNDFTVICRREG
jgi:SAM-dependent methyltransferase